MKSLASALSGYGDLSKRLKRRAHEWKVTRYLDKKEKEHYKLRSSASAYKEKIPDPVKLYLLMAFGGGNNILICGESSEINRNFLSESIKLIPNMDTTTLIEENYCSIDVTNLLFNNIIQYNKNQKGSITDAIDVAKLSNPERIVADEARPDELNDIFQVVDQDASFITTVRSSMQPKNLLESIASNKKRQYALRVSSVDVIIHLSAAKPASIHEYQWLSRGEIIDGESLCGLDLVRCDIIDPSQREQLSASKAFRSYLSATGFDAEECIEFVTKKLVMPS